ncbi:MAG: hypothetical protein ACLR6T_10980 [Intestinibacter sp.]
MISVETYTKILLQKRGMRQADLLAKMKELKLADDKTLVKQKLNNALNIRMGYTWARRIEIALELPDYFLIKMIGTPSSQEWQRIKLIKPMKEEKIK